MSNFAFRSLTKPGLYRPTGRAPVLQTCLLLFYLLGYETGVFPNRINTLLLAYFFPPGNIICLILINGIMDNIHCLSRSN